MIELFCKDWHSWSDSAPKLPKNNNWTVNISPETHFIPAMQRRRLSLLDKSSLFTSFKVIEKNKTENFSSIFATRHGEFQRTLNILMAIAKKDVVSPTEFSTSVHNTCSGIFSILMEKTAPSLVVSACEDTFHAGLMETYHQITTQKRPVMFTYSDCRPPELLSEFLPNETTFSHSLFFVPQKSNAIFSININKKTTTSDHKNENLSSLFFQMLLTKETRIKHFCSFGSLFEMGIQFLKETHD